MDLPDAACDRNRGLPLAQSPPSVRLYIASEPVDDPSKRDRSACALVVSHSDNVTDYLHSPLPARPGVQALATQQGETTSGAATPQLSPNVGRICLSNVSDGMPMEKCLTSDGSHAMSLRSDHTMMHNSDDDSVAMQYPHTHWSLNVRPDTLHNGERQQQEVQHNPELAFSNMDTGYVSANVNSNILFAEKRLHCRLLAQDMGWAWICNLFQCTHSLSLMHSAAMLLMLITNGQLMHD